MVVSVAARRLDRVRVNGRYCRVQIRKPDLLRVKSALLHAVGMEAWREMAKGADADEIQKPFKIAEIKIVLDGKGVTP
jgi:hypothetical protein